MNHKYLAALVLLYLCGVCSGMGLAFRIDEHLAVVKHSEVKP
jgi:hypothetical protein